MTHLISKLWLGTHAAGSHSHPLVPVFLTRGSAPFTNGQARA